MMRRLTLLMALALLMGLAAAAASHTSRELDRFSGIWKMDPARSESTHQDVSLGPSTLVIRAEGDDITIETTRKAAGRSPAFHEILRFRMDGSETPNTGNAGMNVTGKAHLDGEKLVTETVRTVQDSTVTTLYVHTLSANGREMTVDKTLTVQHGYQGGSATNMGHGKDVYVRVSK